MYQRFDCGSGKSCTIEFERWTFLTGAAGWRRPSAIEGCFSARSEIEPHLYDAVRAHSAPRAPASIPERGQCGRWGCGGGKSKDMVVREAAVDLRQWRQLRNRRVIWIFNEANWFFSNINLILINTIWFYIIVRKSPAIFAHNVSIVLPTNKKNKANICSATCDTLKTTKAGWKKKKILAIKTCVHETLADLSGYGRWGLIYHRTAIGAPSRGGVAFGGGGYVRSNRGCQIIMR